MSGRQLVRIDLLDGTSKWRPLPCGAEDPNLHHLWCKQFGLDEHRVYFDLPSSARGVGSASTGYGGQRGGRKINGYVMWRATREPIGVVTFATEGERMRDLDPNDVRDMLSLS